MIIAEVLISPPALHNLVHGVAFYAVIGLALPIIGWRTFLAVFAFPPSGNGRVAAVLTTWVGGTGLVEAVFNLVMPCRTILQRNRDRIPLRGSFWPDLPSVCSFQPVFGARSHRSCRRRLRLEER
jgi:hypothetical protein